MELLIVYFTIFLEQDIVKESFSSQAKTLESISKNVRDEELIEAIVWCRLILRTEDRAKRQALTEKKRRNKIVSKTMIYTLVRFINLPLILKTFVEFQDMPQQELNEHSHFLTALLYEKVKFTME